VVGAAIVFTAQYNNKVAERDKTRKLLRVARMENGLLRHWRSAEKFIRPVFEATGILSRESSSFHNKINDLAQISTIGSAEELVQQR
jgi:hypothetical protein